MLYDSSSEECQPYRLQEMQEYGVMKRACEGAQWGQQLHRCGAFDRRVDTCASCTSIAVAGPKLFWNKLVNPWACGKAPNESRYAHDAL